MFKNEKILREEDIQQRISAQAERLIGQNNTSFEQTVKKGSNNINFGGVERLTEINAAEKISNQIIMESNPQLERSVSIMSGLITCPNGGSKPTLTYSAGNDSDDKTYNVAADKVCKILDDYFTNVDKLPKRLYDMVYKILGIDGSYVTAFIPDSNISAMAESGLESAIKEVINSSSTKKISLDTAADSGTIYFSNNHNLLNLRAMREQKFQIKNAGYGKAGLENAKDKKGINSLAILKRRRNYKCERVVRMSKMTEAELYPAMNMQLPSESVAPMIFKSNPEEPFGFVVILDADGYPVTCDEEIDFDKDLRKMGIKDKTEENQFLTKIANNFTTSKRDMQNYTVNSVYDDFRRYLEKEIYDNLVEGTYAENYSLEEDQILSRIAFHRLLRNKKTHILYLPITMVNYFCFDVDRFGIGRSLVSKTKALSNIYTVLFYANFMGSLSNAIPRKRVTVDFDKDDFDKHKRMEEIVNQLVMSQVGSFNFDYNGPSQLMDNLTRHGLEFNFNNLDEGELPAMDIKIEDYKRDIRPIDTTTTDNVAKLIAMRTGFSPNLIDQSYSPKFSSEVLRENDVTARQLAGYHQRSSENTTDYVVKGTLNNPALMNQCLEACGGSDPEGLLSDILTNLEVALPSDISLGLDENIDAINDVITAVDLIVDKLYPSSYANGIDNATSDQMSYFQDIIKGFLLEDYMRRNSSFKTMIDNVIDLGSLDSQFGMYEERKSGIMQIFADYVKVINKKDANIADDLNKQKEKLGEEDPQPTPQSSSEPTSTEGNIDLTPPDEDDIGEGNAPEEPTVGTVDPDVDAPKEDDDNTPTSGTSPDGEEIVNYNVPPIE